MVAYGLIAIAFLANPGTSQVPPSAETTRSFTTTALSAAGPSTRPYVAYETGSFFRSRLGADPPVDPASSNGIAFVKGHPDQKTAYPQLRGLGGNDWGMPYVMGRAGDPVWKLTGSVPSPVAFLQTRGFHAKERLGRLLTGTSDSPFVVIDRASGLTVWGAKAAVVGPHLIRVGAAGAFEHNSNGLDKRDPLSDSNLNFRSRGVIPDSMLVRADLLKWAMANRSDLGHVLEMFWVETRTADGHVSPMVGHESGKYGWGPEGIRIAIKPSVNVEAKVDNPAGRVIARTLQHYGAYLGDNSGSGCAIKLEQDFGQWGGTGISTDALKGLTWNDFYFVKRGYY